MNTFSFVEKAILLLKRQNFFVIQAQKQIVAECFKVLGKYSCNKYQKIISLQIRYAKKENDCRH